MSRIEEDGIELELPLLRFLLSLTSSLFIFLDRQKNK